MGKGKELKEHGLYEEAIKEFKLELNEDGKKNDIWIWWEIADCYKKLGQNERSLNISLQLYDRNPEFNKNNYLIRQASYTMIKEFDLENMSNYDKYLKCINCIIKTSTPNQVPYLILERALDKTIKYLAKHKKHQDIINIINKIDINLLNSDVRVENIEGKNIKKASYQQKILYSKVKSIYELNQVDEFFIESTEFLNKFNEYSSNYDLWVERMIALKQIQSGKVEEGVQKLKLLLSKLNRHITILSDLTKHYFSCNEIDMALIYAIEGVSSNQQEQSKLGIYLALSEILIKKNELAEAKTILNHNLRIRKQNGWGVSSELNNLMTFLDINFEAIPPYAQTKLELKIVVTKLTDKINPRLKGKIIKTIVEKNIGYIISEEDVEYFFTFKNVKSKPELIKHNADVSFRTSESFDKKKNKQTVIAVDIKIIY